MGLPQRFFDELLRQLGIYTAAWVAENIGSLSSLPTVKLVGVAENYDNKDKKKHRDYIVDEIGVRLGGEPIHYLGLPHTSMLDYLQVASKFVVVPTESLAVERKDHIFNTLQSWVNHRDACVDGSILAGLRLFHGRLSSGLVRLEGEFNFINFDFTGPWTHEVEASVINLFAYARVAPKAVLAITLAESSRWIENPNYPLVTDFHRHFVKPRVQEIAREYGYSARYLWHHRYKEGTIYPMITVAFLLTKKEKGLRC